MRVSGTTAEHWVLWFTCKTPFLEVKEHTFSPFCERLTGYNFFSACLDMHTACRKTKWISNPSDQQGTDWVFLHCNFSRTYSTSTLTANIVIFVFVCFSVCVCVYKCKDFEWFLRHIFSSTPLRDWQTQSALPQRTVYVYVDALWEMSCQNSGRGVSISLYALLSWEIIPKVHWFIKILTHRWHDGATYSCSWCSSCSCS